MRRTWIFYFLILIAINTACVKSGKNGNNQQAAEQIYNVKDFGAVGDGKTNDQKAIQQAIDACRNRGGTVVLKAGRFLSGQLSLVSNMTLHIDSGAVLLGIQSDSDEDYPRMIIETTFPNRMKDDCQRRLIYGNKVENVTITGGGKIHGQGEFGPWMDLSEFGMDKLGTEKDRPSILAFVGSRNITVSNLTLEKPACWTQVYIEVDSLVLRNLKISTGNLQPNRDGIDIVDCHNVLIEDCDIKSQDDGIVFKSGSEYGCKNIVVRRCTIDKLNVTAGNCFKLGTDGLGSFMNFEVSDLILKNAFQNSAIVIESMDGAVIDKLAFTNCKISACGQAFFIMLADRKRTVPGRKKRIGTISNIHFSNISGSGFTQQYPSIITGIKGHNIQNITFDNIDLELRGGIQETDQTVPEYDGSYPEGSKFGNTNASAFFIRHTDRVSFRNCRFSFEEPDVRKTIVTENVIELVNNE